ncbi:MAG TPA: leucine-rich repeat-containing protein kinase family protein [Bacteroidia bacterium]|nr:leucine-rich repeat-containing protein kinase family protein [Bacteroidia bacterium]
MQTLEQLQSGKLSGCTSIRLSCGLTEFPKELFDLADTLELLDLSGNQLSALPHDFGRFKKLKIAFFSDNLFTEYPEVLADCPLLEMIGFKANQIKFISEKAISKNIRWLILTNNQIPQLPKSIGHCYRLQKVALAGNQLTELPDEMANCRNMELLRISANNIKVLPHWLMALPRLSWLAYSDNPCASIIHNNQNLHEIDWSDLELKEQLGEGASGIISKANLKSQQKEVAVKVFKGEVTSDGLPASEMNACALAGTHGSLVALLGKIKNHPLQKDGLVFELIPKSFKNLGKPPSFISCTRDVFDEGTCFSINQIVQIALNTASVLMLLHSRGIMHGDFYAHNLMIDDKANTLLGDFGAATLYDLNSESATLHEKIDVRAYGCLLDDLLSYSIETNCKELDVLRELRDLCFNDAVTERPIFKEIFQKLVLLIN